MRPIDRAARLLGLRVAEHHLEALDRALAKSAQQEGTTAQQLVERAAAHDLAAFGVIAEALTVSETYFLRHPEDFATVREHAELRAAHGSPVLKVWSLGCATGEEVWSLAGVLSPISPTVQVAGSDANSQSLEKARAGRYGASSLRAPTGATIPWLKAAGDGWEVSSALRGNVSFSFTNAAELPMPPAVLGAEVDVIFCRNLLLYFEPAVAEKLVAHLTSLLNHEGLLVLGVLEGPPHAPYGFRRVNFPFSNAWVRTASGIYRPPAPVPTKARVADPQERLEALRQARGAADSGRMEEALKVLKAMRPDPAGLYLMGCIKLELADPLHAEAIFRQVLTLDGDHVLARLQLLLSAVRRGDEPSARRERSELDRTTKGLDELTPLDDEGLTVGYVRRLVEGLKVSSW
jgi:chemotaxis protein methyltransferase CheR